MEAGPRGRGLRPQVRDRVVTPELAADEMIDFVLAGRAHDAVLEIDRPLELRRDVPHRAGVAGAAHVQGGDAAEGCAGCAAAVGKRTACPAAGPPRASAEDG